NVYVDTKKPQKDRTTYAQPKDLRPSDIKILFALLSEPGLESEDYRTIAMKANVALGTIAWHMRMLRAGGFLGPKADGERRLGNKKELFTMWVNGYIQRLRPKLILSRFASDIESRWWEDVDLNEFDAYWGG